MSKNNTHRAVQLTEAETRISEIEGQKFTDVVANQLGLFMLRLDDHGMDPRVVASLAAHAMLQIATKCLFIGSGFGEKEISNKQIASIVEGIQKNMVEAVGTACLRHNQNRKSHEN